MKTHRKWTPPIPRVGDHWQENDRRSLRIVKVVDVLKYAVKIVTVRHFSNDRKISKFKANTTYASIRRFNYKSGGYSKLCGFCHDCQLERGGVVPKHGHMGITISMGTCSRCLAIDTGLVPSSDYDWPAEGKKAIWD